MKKSFKKLGNYFYTIFLFVYLFVMFAHVLDLPRNVLIISLFIFGFILALFAHARKNYITIILLLTHMSIEWFEWSQVGLNLDVRSGLFNLAHVVMDFTFLSHELNAHIKRKKNFVFLMVILLLIVISLLGHFVIPKSEYVIDIIEPFVIGGILGCVLSHLYFHLGISKDNKKHCH